MQVVKDVVSLVFGDDVKGKKCDCGDTGNHKCKQNYDEPRSPVGCLGRRLSDPHCFDEDVRYETDEVHGLFDGRSSQIVAANESVRRLTDPCIVKWARYIY
jgi:hypothetical protein